MSVRIVDVREMTKPIASPIRNAYIDFSKMTTSLVAVVTDVVRDGRPVVGYGFNSNGRYGQGGLIRERFAPRLMEADPKMLLDDAGDNLDPDRVWAALMSNEKPGGHGERVSRQRSRLIDLAGGGEHAHQIRPSADRGGGQSSADDLAHDRQVPPHASQFLRAAARDAKAADHLVQDQQRAGRPRPLAQ